MTSANQLACDSQAFSSLLENRISLAASGVEARTWGPPSFWRTNNDSAIRNRAKPLKT